MKTRALTELLASTSAPALLLKDNDFRWSNDAFKQLPLQEQDKLQSWGNTTDDDLLVCNGTLFERLTAADHTLVIASGHRAAHQQRRLLQALIPLLQTGNNPFFVLPQILCEVLEWDACAACTRLSDSQFSLVGHWQNGQQQPPRTLEQDVSLAKSLYVADASPTQIAAWELPTEDPLLPGCGVWLAQRIDDAKGIARGHLAMWHQSPPANLADSIHVMQLCADLVGSWLPSEATKPEQAIFQSDSLTRLPQRDALDHALTASEHQYPTGDQLLALIDIDNLSRINNERGQQTGDRVLCTFADKLQHLCRPDDRLFRLGGDEFVLLMPVGKQANSLLKRLDQLNRSMAEQLGTAFHASAGIAKLSEANGSGDDLLLIANSRLQQAKQSGNGKLSP
ncbi:GGDEF domain-containing protein [Marinobacterium weihaiense]|uniref:diguanylate cyclase n=1 Tax=Marinobacterium weihaiense TaxID=2851016 RepID=A0ABS6M700_9GAMM|nr:GGDEF domain-containing protein [Marinobacterium weihaiense]MBV0932052.1 GGDEF domain-containing protein [Marinobacterium weihaiense]